MGKKKGRTKGAKALPVNEVEVSEDIKPKEIKTACMKCSSTQREGYTNVREVRNGPKTVTFKSTKCKKCGQARRDRFVT